MPGRFLEQDLAEVRERANLVEVISAHTQLRKAGPRTFKGLCPFHSEKTPSFHVNPEKGFFHCFGCGVGGDVFKFLELHEKLGFQHSGVLRDVGFKFDRWIDTMFMQLPL